MSNRAWMPLDIADYLADTGHLNAAEHGAYLLLIMRYWQDGKLPDDERLIFRFTRMTAEQWAESRDVLASLFSEGWTVEGSAAQRHMQRARKSQRTAVPLDVRRAVFERDGRKCVYCGDADGPFDLDHKTPWRDGGKHTIENMVVACSHCNRSRGAIPYEAWLEIVR